MFHWTRCKGAIELYVRSVNCLFTWTIQINQTSSMWKRTGQSTETLQWELDNMLNTVVERLKHWSRRVLRWKSVCVCLCVCVCVCVCVYGCSPVDERLAHFQRRSGINKHRDRNTDSRYLIQLLAVESEITAQTFNMTNSCKHAAFLMSVIDLWASLWPSVSLERPDFSRLSASRILLDMTDVTEVSYSSETLRLWFIILQIKGVSLVLALLGGHNRHCLIKIIARDNFVVAGDWLDHVIASLINSTPLKIITN